MSKTESITLSTGLQVNRTRRNGVTIITTGAIQKGFISKYGFKIFASMLFTLAIIGSASLTYKLIVDVLSGGAFQLIAITPMLLFIGWAKYLVVNLFIQFLQDEGK